MNVLSIILLLVILLLALFVIWKVFIKKDVKHCYGCDKNCEDCNKK